MTGSGVGVREKLESAAVRSSIVVAALASGDSGVDARELPAASGLAIIARVEHLTEINNVFQLPHSRPCERAVWLTKAQATRQVYHPVTFLNGSATASGPY